MQSKTIEKYFFLGSLCVIFIFAFFIFRPFWVVLVMGASLSVVFYPVYEWFTTKRVPSWLSAILTLFLFILLLCIPLLSIGSIVFDQSQNLYHSIVSSGNAGPFMGMIENKINQVLPSGVSFDLNTQASEFVSFLTKNIANIFSATITAIFSFVLLLLTIFYFLKDGENWKNTLLKLSPLSNVDDEKILARLVRTINGVIKGYLFIALIQGTLMGIGLTIFHVPNPAIWGVVAAIASIIPPLGTAVVSIPAIIFLFITDTTGTAIGLLIWSVAIVGAGDNFLNPYIVGSKINVPPFLVLFSVLGGIALLGPIGILIGPLTVSMLYTLVEVYRNEI